MANTTTQSLPYLKRGTSEAIIVPEQGTAQREAIVAMFKNSELFDTGFKQFKKGLHKVNSKEGYGIVGLYNPNQADWSIQKYDLASREVTERYFSNNALASLQNQAPAQESTELPV